MTTTSPLSTNYVQPIPLRRGQGEAILKDKEITDLKIKKHN